MLIRRLVALLALIIALPATAASVLPLYLDEIIDTAATAFQGTCTGNRTERDAQTGLIVTYTTFLVQERLKGDVGTSITIKQIGGRLSDGSMEFEMPGVPTFAVGGSYVVFLHGVSQAGFSSPVGLGQGRFTIIAGENGAQVTNGRDFKDMASRIAGSAPREAQAKLSARGPVMRLGLDDFKALVRQRSGPIQ